MQVPRPRRWATGFLRDSTQTGGGENRSSPGLGPELSWPCFPHLWKGPNWEFLDGPVVRTQCFHCRDLGSIPGQGTKIPQVMWHSQKKKKLTINISFLPDQIVKFTLSQERPGASQVGLVVNNPPANTEDVRDLGSIPGSGRPPGGGHGTPPQWRIAWTEEPGRGTWCHTRSQSRTRLNRLRTHACKQDQREEAKWRDSLPNGRACHPHPP